MPLGPRTSVCQRLPKSSGVFGGLCNQLFNWPHICLVPPWPHFFSVQSMKHGPHTNSCVIMRMYGSYAAKIMCFRDLRVERAPHVSETIVSELPLPWRSSPALLANFLFASASPSRPQSSCCLTSRGQRQAPLKSPAPDKLLTRAEGRLSGLWQRLWLGSACQFPVCERIPIKTSPDVSWAADVDIVASSAQILFRQTTSIAFILRLPAFPMRGRLPFARPIRTICWMVLEASLSPEGPVLCRSIPEIVWLLRTSSEGLRPDRFCRFSRRRAI